MRGFRPGWLRGCVLCSMYCVACVSAAWGEGARSPEEERATFQLADETLDIELVASEPLIDSPVAICWNARGDLYVAEMRDYPVGPASGRVSRLSDRDGDGRYETSVVLAEGLKFPNSVLAVAGGVLVTAAPDLLFLPDPLSLADTAEQHPEQAAARVAPRVVLTGLAEGNQQLRANGLTWGLDNWIYGANGRSNGRLRLPEEPAEGGVSIEGRDFRLQLAPLRVESVLGQSQFGQARDDWGNRFISWNTIPLRQVLFDARSVAANPHLASEAVREIADPADDGRVFPISPQPQTFNRESTSYYNALCGLTIFRGDALGESYRGNAFVGESLTNLVHRRVLESAGPTYVSRRGERGKEFLASSDPWFHPVYFATGPDGGLYVVDFYRRWVEHPQFVPESMREQVAWQEGIGHGRIWRIRKREVDRPAGPISPLADAKERVPQRLVTHLSDANGWVRDAAQRLLVEQGAREVADELRRQVKSDSVFAAVHALGVLEGTGELDEGTLLVALRHGDAKVRRRAIEMVGTRTEVGDALMRALADRVRDPDAGVRFELAGALGRIASPRQAELLAELICQSDAEGWCGLAASAVTAEQAAEILRVLHQQKRSLDEAVCRTLFRLAEQVGTGDPAGVEQVVGTWLESSKPSETASLAVGAGLARGLGERGSSLAPLLGANRSMWVDRAKTAIEQDESARSATWGLEILRGCGSAEDVPFLLTRMRAPAGANQSEELARVAVLLCDRAAGESLLAQWNQAETRWRRAILTAGLESPLMRELLVEAVEAEQLAITEMEPAQRAILARGLNGERAEQWQAWMAAAQGPPRDEVVTSYREAAESKGDGARGAGLFVAHCSACHELFGVGKRVGPDLTSVASRPKELVLLDVLDPSRQLAPGYMGYTLVTTEGQILSGLLAGETSAGVSLRLGEGVESTVARERIETLAATGKSLMPEGFESKISIQEMADLLEFLRQPSREYLEQAVHASEGETP
jgi:putative membrane-bound dehydrogenase-like protein